MNCLDALKSVIKYPLEDSTLEKVLLDRGLSVDTEYSKDYAGAIDLCKADTLIVLATAVSISEGGFSVGKPDSEKLISVANSIYSRYGEPLYGEPQINKVR